MGNKKMDYNLSEGNIKTMCYIILGLFIMGGGVLFILGFSTLSPTEIGLDYSWISKSVNKKSYDNGFYFLGIGHSFIKYPKMVQTIEFSKDRGADAAPLQSRTKDGLEVVIEISFQYTIDQTHLYDLFENYAIDVLTEETTHYTAYDFFDKRVVIKTDFEDVLRKVFLKECFSDVAFLQLRSVDLPNAFEKAIQQTEVQKQGINLAVAEAKKVNVELQTAVKSALYQKNVTVNLAEGNAQAILQNNRASVTGYNTVQNSQTKAYSNLKKKLNLDNNDLLKMIKTQVIGDYNGNDLALNVQSPEEKPKK